MGPEAAHARAAAPQRATRRLIVNADDFGASSSINQAVIQSHQQGILTTASLMVNEPACAEAVQLARANPSLGVGLHLTFLCGHSALPHSAIPGLVNARGEFTSNPVAAGMRYFFRRELRPQLHAELRAQFERFQATGLKLDHVNGHLHLHLHPAILPLIAREAARFGVRHVRLTRDPLDLNTRLAKGRWAYRLSHAAVFRALAASAAPIFRKCGFLHTSRVFGLLQNAHVDEAYVSALIERLPPGDSELYSHPSLHEFRHEFEAVASPRMRARAQAAGIQLIRYQDL